MSSILVTENWQPKPTTNLVESIPVKKGEKLSKITSANNHYSWEDLRGASWLLNDEWSFLK